MQWLTGILQVLLGAGFIGFGATKLLTNKMVSEYKRFGLPIWFKWITGSIEGLCGILLIVGLWYPLSAIIGALILVFMMLGAVITHARIRDPIPMMAVPILLFAAGVVIVFVNYGMVNVS